jgi:hypothetical protein
MTHKDLIVGGVALAKLTATAMKIRGVARDLALTAMEIAMPIRVEQTRRFLARYPR